MSTTMTVKGLAPTPRKVREALHLSPRNGVDFAIDRAGLVSVPRVVTRAKGNRNAAPDDLDKKIDAIYPKLTEAEIKTLVIDDKWIARLQVAVQSELDRVSQTLTGRGRELAVRYAAPLPWLSDEVATLAARVEEHLKPMGATWN